MSIYITGDIHGYPERLNRLCLKEPFIGGKDKNTVIITGDFGLIWQNQKDIREEYWLNWLENKPFTTVFVDGNHENHPRLNTYPLKEWNGGKVHEIRPNVLHLMRGEIYVIEGRKFFAFGGASSHDISDGILDCNDKHWMNKAKVLERQGKHMYRVKGLSWWEEELPTKEEMETGIRNLEKSDWTVDFIITHSPPASIISLLGSGLYEQDILTEYLENIRQKVNYANWFMGHMHINGKVNDKDVILYESILRLI